MGGYEDLDANNLSTGTTLEETQLRKIVSLDRLRQSSVKTDDYTVLVDDDYIEIILGSATAANKTFTFDTMTSDEDGKFFYFRNDSDYSLTIKGESTVKVHTSGIGYGIINSNRGEIILRYDHSLLTFFPVSYSGKWMIENLKLWIPGTEIKYLSMDATAAGTDATVPDLSDNHLITANVGLGKVAAGDYNSTINFNGTDEYLSSPDSTDWDTFGDKTDTKTIFLRAYFSDALGSADEVFMSQIEDASNHWYLMRDTSAAGALNFVFNSGGVSDTINGGALAATTWYDITLVHNAGDIGIYVDDTQVAFLATADWTEDTFAGVLSMACYGDGTSDFCNCYINDVVIAYQNLFNAAPVVGVTDTITIPKFLNLTLE